MKNKKIFLGFNPYTFHEYYNVYKVHEDAIKNIKKKRKPFKIEVDSSKFTKKQLLYKEQLRKKYENNN